MDASRENDAQEPPTTRPPYNAEKIAWRREMAMEHLSKTRPDLGPLFPGDGLVRERSRDGEVPFPSTMQPKVKIPASERRSVPTNGDTKLPVCSQRRRRRSIRAENSPWGIKRAYLTIPVLLPKTSLSYEAGFQRSAQVTIGPQSCPSRLTSLIPPGNFGAVDTQTIFRSALPYNENVPFLQSLNIRTVVTLTDSPPTGEFHAWLKASDIAHHQIDLGKNKDGHSGVSLSAMCRALLVVMNSNHWPLHIHCNQGKHRTGCVVACFRRIQNLELRGQGRKTTSRNEIIDEYDTYAGKKARDADREFIGNFKPKEVFEFALRQGMFKALMWRQLVPEGLLPPVVPNVRMLTMVLLVPHDSWDELKEVRRPMVQSLPETPACAVESESSLVVRSPAAMGPCAG